MASKLPLVLNAGEASQLQAGDMLVNDSGVFITATNDSGASTAVGDVMRVLNIGNSFAKAQAHSIVTYSAIAFATAIIANGATGIFQLAGLLTGLSGLIAGNTYYLSPATAGLMVGIIPTTAGQFVVHLGKALTTTSLIIQFKPPILLQ